MSDELKDFSMTELFRLEAEGQLAALTSALLELEQGGNPEQLEAMMRAAHSLKGAARIVGLDVAVQVAQVMEDAFVTAQRGAMKLGPPHIDRMPVGVDLLSRIAATPEAEMDAWNTTQRSEVVAFLAALKAAMAGEREAPAIAAKPPTATPAASPAGATPALPTEHHALPAPAPSALASAMTTAPFADRKRSRRPGRRSRVTCV